MKLFNRFCWLALLIGILIVVMMSLPGCGGKKKLVQKSESSTEVAAMEKVLELEEKKKETKAETNTSNETLSTNENENVEADIADPDKDFELKKETKDGKTTW